MQVNLVFSPFIIPRVPLGIASIKASVEKYTAFRVSCFDLNAQYHASVIEGVRHDQGMMALSPEDKAAFLRAVDTFENKDGTFYEREAYDEAYDQFYKKTINPFTAYFNPACGKAIRDHSQTPWFVQSFVAQLLSNEPDVVGFSVMLPQQLNASGIIACLLKEARSDIKIVFGGNTSTTACERLVHVPYVDYVVRDEGEKSFVDLLKHLNGDLSLEDVPNLSYLHEGEVVLNELAMIKKPDVLPFPDYSDFDLNRYLSPDPVVSVLGSRGCYWRKCTFCTHHKSYFNAYRQASVERVVDELESLVSQGIHYFDFVDEMISASRFRKLALEILRRQLSISYYALAKPTADFTHETLDLMHKSGCRYLIWGVESGCQRILDLMQKGTRVKDVGVVLNESARAGIKNHLFIIVGFPSETREELEETLEFLYEHRECIHAIHNDRFYLYPHSPVHDHQMQFGITKAYVSPSGLSQEAVRYEVATGLTQEEALAYREFYHKNFFQWFNVNSDALVTIRHHALSYYANENQGVSNQERQYPPRPSDIRAVVEA